MSEKKSKRIRAHGDTLSILWLRGLLSEDEALKINMKNIKDKMPTQTHFRSKGQIKLSACTSRWVVKQIKKVLKREPKRELHSILTGDVFND